MDRRKNEERDRIMTILKQKRGKIYNLKDREEREGTEKS